MRQKKSTALFVTLYDSEQYKSHGVNCEIGEHMDKPRGINVVVALIEVAENTAAYNQSEHQKQQNADVEHLKKHTDMIHRKHGRTENIGDFS